ncbi:hypothetical protein ACXU40_09235 [Bordetella bronchiseptica]
MGALMLRRTPLQRKTPLRATGARLSSGSSAGLTRHAPLQRAAIERRVPKKRSGYHDPKYLAACRGEQCFLAIQGVCRGECHTELDQGYSLTDQQKRAAWEWAYNRWLPVRTKNMEAA